MTTSITAIYVHGGIFHGDDVAATAAVRLLKPGCEVKRVFALPPELPEGSLVIDVGGVYNPAENRFDHHQETSRPPARANGCPRASFGALWGSELGRDIVGAVAGAQYPELPFGAVSRIRDLLDLQIVQGVDAQDEMWSPRLVLDQGEGGLEASLLGWEGAGVAAPDGARFTVEALPAARPGEGMSLSVVISGFNPRYDEPSSPADRDAAFEAAVSFTEGALRRAILREAGVLMAEHEVISAPTESEGQVLVLQRFVPWQEALLLRPGQERLLYVVFPSERGGYCVQQVPLRPGSGEGRKPLPKAWAGKRGAELAEATGLTLGASPSVFVHPGRFVGGAATLADTLAMARLAVFA
jgi:uncharacterized UPF0160 family protein